MINMNGSSNRGKAARALWVTAFLLSIVAMALIAIPEPQAHAQAALASEPIRLLKAEAEKEEVLYKLAYGDPKVLAKTIEDAITNVNPDRNKGALIALTRLGRTVELKHAAKLVEHEDEELAGMAALALLRSSDLKQVREMLKLWDKLEAEKPERAEMVRESLKSMNSHPDALKEVMSRAKTSKLPDQAKAALDTINHFIPDMNLSKLEDIEAAFKKPEFQKLLKARSTPQAALGGAFVPLYVGIDGKNHDLSGNNIVLSGGSFERALTRMKREANEGFEIRFKVLLQSEEDVASIVLDGIDGERGGFGSKFGGFKLTCGQGDDQKEHELKAKGTWVECRIWWMPFFEGGPMTCATVNGVYCETKTARLWISPKNPPMLRVGSVSGSITMTIPELRRITKGP